MKVIWLFALLFISLLSFSQTNKITIVPEPAEINVTGGYITIKAPLSKNHPAIRINKTGGINSSPEGYEIVAGKQNIRISGSDKGIFYAFQTLQQLNVSRNKAEIKIPCCTIKDYPRFPYRGMHLDVGRHFFPPSFIKKYIDYMAYHKFNTFHWHLTEDQGWRIEIKKYPRLTSVGGFRNGTIIGRNPGKGNDNIRYGGFYTQREIKDIVKYAADRYITIIPEIEMPGHSSAAIAAYPQLSCFPDETTIMGNHPSVQSLLLQKMPLNPSDTLGRKPKLVQERWGVFEDVFCPTEYTFNFLENVLDEVMHLFPSRYIHIGGDECPKASWKRSEFCQQLIKKEGLKDEHGLQSYFIRRIEKYLNSKGRQIIGWDEILEGGLAPNATVMSWRGEQGGIEAAKQKHNVVMTPEPYLYFNFSQSTHDDSLTYGQYLPVEKVYSYEPIPKELNGDQVKYILGAQANLWSEYINNPKLAEYQLFPRMSALSEVLWSPKEKRDPAANGWKNFEIKLPVLFKRYQQWGASYSTAYYELQPAILPSPNYDGVLWKLESNNREGNIIYVNGRSQSATHNYTSPVLIRAGGEFGAALTRNDHTFITGWLWQKFSFNKATGKKITLTNNPKDKWTGSGAFTLVNGVITENRLSQSNEWIGLLGKDIEAVIDMGKEEQISVIRINTLKQENSWIYLPAYVEFFVSNDGTNFTSVGKLLPDANGIWKDERRIELKLTGTSARFIKVLAKNYGVIPAGKPGAGNTAWLFADEIEVE